MHAVTTPSFGGPAVPTVGEMPDAHTRPEDGSHIGEVLVTVATTGG